MLRVAQGAPSRGERSNCGAERVDTYTIRACSHEMSKLSNMENSARRACARCQKKPICGVKFQPVGRPSKTSADGKDCESAPGGENRHASSLGKLNGSCDRGDIRMPCMLQTVVSHKRKPCMLALFRKRNLDRKPVPVDWLPYRPGTGVSSAGRPLQCCCQNGVGMQTCPEVLKEPSKRRCRWPGTGVPTEGRTLVSYRNHPQRRVKQRGQQVQQRSLSKYRNGISSTQTEALAKAVANACMKSTMCPKTNRL